MWCQQEHALIVELHKLNGIGYCEIGPFLSLAQLVRCMTTIQKHIVLDSLESASTKSPNVFLLLIDNLWLGLVEFLNLFKKIGDNSPVLL